jgi:hypothetical protein
LSLLLGQISQFRCVTLRFYKQVPQVVVLLITPQLSMGDIDHVILIDHPTWHRDFAAVFAADKAFDK